MIKPPSLPDPPQNITLVDNGRTWLIRITTPNATVIKGGRVAILLGSFFFMITLFDFLGAIIGVLFSVGWFVLIRKLWLVTNGYHQDVQLVLHSDRFLIRQTTFLSWREDYVLYTKEELKEIRVGISLEKNLSSLEQKGLQIETNVEGVNPFFWGAFLKEDQLLYIKQLLVATYIEEQNGSIFSFKDFSEHLLED